MIGGAYLHNNSSSNQIIVVVAMNQWRATDKAAKMSVNFPSVNRTPIEPSICFATLLTPSLSIGLLRQALLSVTTFLDTMSKPEDFNLESLVSTAQQLGPKKRSQFLLLFSPETRDAITRTLEGLEKDSGHPSVEDLRSRSAKTLIIDPTESDDEELTQSGSSVPLLS